MASMKGELPGIESMFGSNINTTDESLLPGNTTFTSMGSRNHRGLVLHNLTNMDIEDTSGVGLTAHGLMSSHCFSTPQTTTIDTSAICENSTDTTFTMLGALRISSSPGSTTISPASARSLENQLPTPPHSPKTKQLAMHDTAKIKGNYYVFNP